MGTLLLNKNSGKTIWSPPNGVHDTSSLGSALSFAVSGYFANAAERQTLYDTTSAIVSPFGQISTKGCDLSEQEAKRRGWGSIHSDSYHSTLAWFEEQLNNPMAGGKLLGAWAAGDPNGENFALKPILGTAPASYGAYGPDADALHANSDEFKKFCQYRYPVYAIGYNWLQSNLDSARDVVEGLDCFNKQTGQKLRLMGIKEICKENNVKKAIVITHSMGGLVARMGTVIAGHADLMYGVIHGAQPATGAPLAARRFRSGAAGEGAFLNNVLVGRDGPEFTGLTVNAPGPLELLPMPDYHNAQPWWIFRNIRREEILSLPKPGDTLGLYTTTAWYGLVPEQSTAVLDPAGIVKQRLAKANPNMSLQENFLITMKGVVMRQKRLINKYHPNTYAFYGSGPLLSKEEIVSAGLRNPSSAPIRQEISETSETLRTFGRVYWRGNFPSGTTESDLLSARLLSDQKTGRFRLLVKGQAVDVEAEPMLVAQTAVSGLATDRGQIPGDGTVPVWSSEAAARGVKDDVAGGKADGVQIAFAQKGFGHQECFKHPWARWAVLYSMVKIAKSIEIPA